MKNIMPCFISFHCSIKNTKSIKLETLIQKHFTKLIEGKRDRLTDALAFSERTTKCENVLFHIAKPEIVLKTVRSNTKAQYAII